MAAACAAGTAEMDFGVFTMLLLFSIIGFIAVIGAASKYFSVRRKKNRIERGRKSSRVSSDDIERRVSQQELNVKRLLVQTGKLAPGSSGKQGWEIEYKKIKLKRRIGAGSFGEVWLGTWLGSHVAVKTVSRNLGNAGEFMPKFLAEIDLMSRLHHPNIVMFLGACITAPNVCLVLEFCNHGNLLDFLNEEDKHEISISMHLMLKIALDIARGINYLHQKENIIQRDIKSRNILVDDNLNAKVADFGLSRLKEEDGGMTACGTPAWTAPEVVRMEDYTEKVDVYSFGVVMWEVVMREEPYGGEAGVQIAYAAAEQGLRPEIPTHVPDCYTKLMTECWADNAHDRPNFGQILERLFKMMKDESNPFRQAYFYFGQRDYEPDQDVLAYLEDEDLSAGCFEEDLQPQTLADRLSCSKRVLFASSSTLSVGVKSGSLDPVSAISASQTSLSRMDNIQGKPTLDPAEVWGSQCYVDNLALGNDVITAVSGEFIVPPKSADVTELENT